MMSVAGAGHHPVHPQRDAGRLRLHRGSTPSLPPSRSCSSERSCVRHHPLRTNPSTTRAHHRGSPSTIKRPRRTTRRRHLSLTGSPRPSSRALHSSLCGSPHLSSRALHSNLCGSPRRSSRVLPPCSSSRCMRGCPPWAACKPPSCLRPACQGPVGGHPHHHPSSRCTARVFCGCHNMLRAPSWLVCQASSCPCLDVECGSTGGTLQCISVTCTWDHGGLLGLRCEVPSCLQLAGMHKHCFPFPCSTCLVWGPENGHLLCAACTAICKWQGVCNHPKAGGALLQEGRMALSVG